jgi:DNA repair protein RecO (recombination protein O)
MEFEDDAFVLSARTFGESGAIVELLTAARGRWAAHVAGGASRRMRPFLQAGARVTVRYRSRVSDQLGSAALEAVGQGPSALFDDPLALAGLAAAAAVCAQALPEREPHPGAFLAFEALAAACCRTWVSASTSPNAPPPAARTTSSM